MYICMCVKYHIRMPKQYIVLLYRQDTWENDHEPRSPQPKTSRTQHVQYFGPRDGHDDHPHAGASHPAVIVVGLCRIS
jgi:hypothetical protein